MITTSYESFSSPRLRHMRRLRKSSRMEELLLERRQGVQADRPVAEVLRRVRDGLPHVLAERHVPAVAGLVACAGGRGLARHRAAGDCGGGAGGGQEVEAAGHERSSSPSGSKNGCVTTSASIALPPSEITTPAPSLASAAG